MKTFGLSFLSAVCAASVLFAGVALMAADAAAQDQAQAPAPQKQVSLTVVKNFNGWEVRCASAAIPSPCDVREMLANKKTGQRVASLSLSYIPARDAHVMVIVVPLGVVLAKGVTIVSDNYTSPVLHYRRCDSGGCYVETLVDSSVISGLSGATEAKIQIMAEGDAKPIAMTFPMNGFSDAHNAMIELARQKAPAAPAAQAAPAPDTAAPQQ